MRAHHTYAKSNSAIQSLESAHLPYVGYYTQQKRRQRHVTGPGEAAVSHVFNGVHIREKEHRPPPLHTLK